MHCRAVSAPSIPALQHSIDDLDFDAVLFPDSPRSEEEHHDFHDFSGCEEDEHYTTPECDQEDILIEPDAEGNFSVSFKSSGCNFKMNPPKVALEDFEILALVGKGAYGKVHQVCKKNTGEIFAMKVMRKESLIKTNNVSYTITERNILRNIRHPFIASLHYAFQTKGKVYLVMDFLNGGQLFHHMRKQAMFTEDAVRIYAAELVLAIEHLHSCNIVHRDLKPENILMSAEGHLCVADFGLAKDDVTDETKTKTFCGTVEYMAPEIIQGIGHGKAVDWWSLGILMFDMLTGSTPFKAKKQESTSKRNCKG